MTISRAPLSKRFTAPTGLAVYGFRYYSPELGRFISRDPKNEIGHRLATGRKSFGEMPVESGEDYLFVKNDAINLFDLLGLEWHHLLPQAIFDQLFMSAHDIKDLDIHDEKYGWELDFRTHRGKGTSVHSAGWNKDWKNWIKGENLAGRKIDKCSIEKQLGVMRKNYSSFLSQGSPVKGRYRPVKYGNFSQGAGIGAGLILASLLAGELTGANAAKAEEVQRSIENYNSATSDFDKLREAGVIAATLSELTGANSTILLGAFFKLDGELR